MGRTLADIMAVQQSQAKSSGRAVTENIDADEADSDSIRPDSEGYGSHGDTDTGDVTSTSQDRWSENNN